MVRSLGDRILGVNTVISLLFGVRGLDTVGRFSVIVYKGANFCDFLFVFSGTKGSTVERKHLLPLFCFGFFVCFFFFCFFREDSFSEGSKPKLVCLPSEKESSSSFFFFFFFFFFREDSFSEGRQTKIGLHPFGKGVFFFYLFFFFFFFFFLF